MLRGAPWFLLLSCFAWSGPASAAAETFGLEGDRAALAARSPDEWVRQAQLLEKRRDWPGLLTWGQAWAQVDAKNPLPWFIRGRALGEMGRYAEAIAAYGQNVRIAPRDAMRAYRAAVEIDPDYIQAWHNLGLTFYRSKGQAGVTQALQELQATDPALAQVWRTLAIEYSVTRDPRVAREAVKVLRGLSAAERARMFRILFDET